MKPAILITGAARRLGAHSAAYLAARGHDIALHYNSSSQDAKRAAAAVEAAGAKAVLIQADLQSPQAPQQIIQEAKAAFSHLGVLINNASIFQPSSFHDTTPKILEHNMTMHFTAPYFLSQSFVQNVEKGVIINMIDSFTTRESHSYFTYLLSKKMLSTLTTSLAHTLAPDFRVNAVAPGVILPLGEFDEAYMQKRAANAPMQSLATPDDIAQAISLLIETEALTGHILYTDGGEHLQ